MSSTASATSENSRQPLSSARSSSSSTGVRALSSLTVTRIWIPTAARRSISETARSGVEVERAVAHEAAEQHAPLARQVDRERGRRADGHDSREARQARLLDELERSPAAQAGEDAWKREFACEEPRADRLVHRVVSADVLAQHDQLAVGGEEPGGVQPAGAF